MQQTCKHCQASFDLSQEDLDLLEKLSPTIAGEKFPLPPPKLCFQCNLQQRLAFYNCRNLYRRTCDATGKKIISTYSPDKPYKVYETKYWYSDQWNPLDYGREIDFSRPFFEQMGDLMQDVPQINLAILGDNQNSDFTNDNYKTKNCYLVFDGERAQDSYYGQSFVELKSCIDFLNLEYSELCYECTGCQNCYNLRYSRYCKNCSESWFLRDCIGCKNCFGCTNLHQKEYHIYNEPKSREEYEAFISNFNSNSHQTIREARIQADEHHLSHPVRATRGVQNIQSSGSNINQCKNSHHCFDGNQLHDCRYCTGCLLDTKDSYRVHIWGDGLELAYNCALVGANSRNLISDYYVLIGCSDVHYSQWCSRSSHHLFGCIGLRHKEYCILNKQYSKEKYEQLVPKLIEHMQETGEWGEFFPPEIAYFGYNESMAQMFFPSTREDITSRGWKWNDYETEVDGTRTIPADQLPDTIEQIPDDVLNWAIICERSGKPYKIISQELQFYRAHNLPLPRLHPDERHKDRFAYKDSYVLYTRSCANCSQEIQTTYPSDAAETVLCEECYLKEVY